MTTARFQYRRSMRVSLSLLEIHKFADAIGAQLKFNLPPKRQLSRQLPRQRVRERFCL